MLTSAPLLHGRSAADLSPAYAAALPRTLYQSSFWTIKEIYETSYNGVNPAISAVAGVPTRGCSRANIDQNPTRVLSASSRIRSNIAPRSFLRQCFATITTTTETYNSSHRYLQRNAPWWVISAAEHDTEQWWIATQPMIWTLLWLRYDRRKR